MLPQKQRGVFITGTDTGVGKTFFGCYLTTHCYQRGIQPQPRKPIESGCHMEANQLIPTDGLAYHLATHKTADLDLITPYRLKHALAPYRAALLEDKYIDINDLYTAATTNIAPEDYLIIEGAGGFLSPLSHKSNNRDLANLLQLPIVVVAANKLGCINHIMLTLEAISHQKLTIAAIILNQITSIPDHSVAYNAKDIAALTEIPVLQIAYKDTKDVSAACQTVYSLT